MPTIEIGVEASEQVDMANLQRVSPSEPLHALLFACARDLREITAVSQAVDEGRAEEDATTATNHTEKIQKWRRLLTSVPTLFRVLPGENPKCFASIQARIDIAAHTQAVARKPAQWAMEIVLHQHRLHRQRGGRVAPGAEKVAEDLRNNLKMTNVSQTDSPFEPITKTFVDNCITIHDRLLRHADLLQLAMASTWDKVNKLHILCCKAGNRDNIKWVMQLVEDMLVTGQLTREDVSGRALKGHEGEKGFVALLLPKRQLRDKLLELTQQEFSSGWQPEAFVKLRELFEDAPQFRKSMESLAWQRDFPDSAIRVMEVIEALLFSRPTIRRCAPSLPTTVPAQTGPKTWRTFTRSWTASARPTRKKTLRRTSLWLTCPRWLRLCQPL